MQVIAQISDLHLGEKISEHMEIDPNKNFIAVLEDVKKRGIKEIIITGDICSRDSAEWLHELLEKYRFEYTFVLGNHDDWSIIKDIFKMKQKYFSFMDNDRIHIVLDSSQGEIDTAQLCWFRNEFNKTKDNEVVLFIHHPILDCGGSVMDKLYPLLNRDEVESVINSSKQKTVVFCGHYHCEDIREKENITQYIAPSTFYQLKKYGSNLEIDNIPIGYRIITFDKAIEAKVVRVDC